MKKLIQIFFHLSRGKQIAAAVVLTHLTVLFFLTCHHLFTRTSHHPRPMVIKTISPLARIEKKGPETPSVQTTQKLAAAPSLKKEKFSTDKITPMKKKSAPPKKHKPEPDVLKEIAESFDVLASEAPKKTVRPSLNVPIKKTPKTKEPEERSSSTDATYDEYLIAFLQNALDLPEFGDVKMEIEMDSFGKIIDCRILESKSSKNAKFLKEEIESLHFPIPFDMEKKHKFTIVFRNK